MIALCIVISMMVAVIGCCLYLWCGSRPSVWLAVVTAMVVPLVFLSFDIDWSRVFTHAYWAEDADDKFGILDAGLPICGLITAVCLIPTSIVVFIFQRKWKKRVTKA
jgi:hypothetical protein